MPSMLPGVKVHGATAIVLLEPAEAVRHPMRPGEPRRRIHVVGRDRLRREELARTFARTAAACRRPPPMRPPSSRNCIHFAMSSTLDHTAPAAATGSTLAFSITRTRPSTIVVRRGDVGLREAASPRLASSRSCRAARRCASGSGLGPRLAGRGFDDRAGGRVHDVLVDEARSDWIGRDRSAGRVAGSLRSNCAARTRGSRRCRGPRGA